MDSFPARFRNCDGDARNIIEGTIGFWYRVYNGPKGRFQWGPQYSYVVKNTWSGVDAVGAGRWSSRDRQHGIHVVPLLPALDRLPVREAVHPASLGAHLVLTL